MDKRFAAAVLAAIFCFSVFAQSVSDPVPAPDSNLLPLTIDDGICGLIRAIAQLRTRASFLMVTAHPDDEDGGMLAYETRQAGARGALLSLTRGEGGQDAVAPYLYDALGLLRTQELLAASRYYGTDLYWGTVIDYGFSKTREEAIEKWGHERVLGDVVRVIRMTRPLVVTSVWAGAPTDGHGNHQVAGQMAQEAFVAAGDPAKFPEQIRAGLRPWTPLKMYARVPFFEPTPKGIYDYATEKYVPVRFRNYIDNTWIEGRPSADLSIPEGAVQPGCGLTSAQIGRTGLGFEKSQNGGFATPPAVPLNAQYHRYASRVSSQQNAPSLFDGIDTSLPGIASLASGDTGFLKDGLTRVQALADQAGENLKPDRPAAIAPLLADGLKELRSLEKETERSALANPGKEDVLFELGQKDIQFQDALALSLATKVDVFTAPAKPPTGPFAAFSGPQPVFEVAIPGQSFFVQAHIYNAGSEPVAVEAVDLASTAGPPWTVKAESGTKPNLAAGQDETVRFNVQVPETATYTRPYFTRPDEEQPYYDLLEAQYQSLSGVPYPLVLNTKLAYRGVTFAVSKSVLNMQRVEGFGLLAYPLQSAPAVSVEVSPSAGAVPLTSKSFSLSVTLRGNMKQAASGELRLEVPAGWTARPEQYPFTLQREGDIQTVTFEVQPQNIQAEAYTIKATAMCNGKTYKEGYEVVAYPGIRPSYLYRHAAYRAIGVDVKTAPDLTAGYIPGTGDDLPRSLENLGVHVRTLTPGEAAESDLTAFKAIVLGVRAYSVPSVRALAPKLSSYVKEGGTLLVQYNTQDFEGDLGPYPISLGGSPARVVDESSQIRFLDAANPIFNWPNKITAADFANWQEERGHGFAAKWDSHYTALVETHDPEQDPQSGGLLVARFGKGVFIYDAFALYRQLPAGVPGAYRILANLISASENPEWKK